MTGFLPVESIDYNNAICLANSQNESSTQVYDDRKQLFDIRKKLKSNTTLTVHDCIVMKIIFVLF